MQNVTSRAQHLRKELTTQADGLRAVFRPPVKTRPIVSANNDRTALVLGIDQGGKSILLPERVRRAHMHVLGIPDSGKSKFLEHCALQDIINGCGFCLIDPHGSAHGSLYRSVLTWLAQQGRTDPAHPEYRPIHLIDLDEASHVTGFNPLARPTPKTDLSVVAAVALEAFERVWGDEDTLTKPNIRRVLTITFKVLAELGLTLAEAARLYDRADQWGLRAYALSNNRIADQDTYDGLRAIDELARDPRSTARFELEVIGPTNRLAEFVSAAAIRNILGQTAKTLDLGEALAGNHIILANLQGGDLAHETHTRVLGLLLTRFIFFHAKRRGEEWKRPFFVYIDECHDFLSGDIPRMLAELRKYGVGVILSHQWLRQLGERDEELREAVLKATKTKILFQLADQTEAEEMALSTMRLDLETPVTASIRPTVIDYEISNLKSESEADQVSMSKTRNSAVADTLAETFTISHSVADTSATATGETALTGSGTSQMTSQVISSEAGWFAMPQVLSTTNGANASQQSTQGSTNNSMRGRTTGSAEAYGVLRGRTTTSGEAESLSEGKTRTRGTAETLKPILKPLPTSFHSKENMLYRAGQYLLGLRTGECVASFTGSIGKVTYPMRVPTIRANRLSQVDFNELRQRLLATASSAKPAAEAVAALENRKTAILRDTENAQLCLEPNSFTGFRHKKQRLPKPES